MQLPWLQDPDGMQITLFQMLENKEAGQEDA
jgi:hypothetical protein